LADLGPLLAVPPQSLEFYRPAALILAANSRDNPDRQKLAFRFLAGAVRLGANPQALPDEPVLEHLRDHPEFQAIVAMPQSPNPVAPDAFRLAEPQLP